MDGVQVESPTASPSETLSGYTGAILLSNPKINMSLICNINLKMKDYLMTRKHDHNTQE